MKEMIAIIILNFIAVNLLFKTMIMVSACFSILYFIMALFQIGHIIWNRFHYNSDWQAVPKSKEQKHEWKRKLSLFQQLRDSGLFNFSNRLAGWFWGGIVLLLLLVLVFPILHV